MGDDGHECENCTHVFKKEDIYAAPDIVRALESTPVFLGFFALSGWVGHEAFYVFRCQKCKDILVDCPHGYIKLGLLYFNCRNCGKMPIEVPGNEEIYRRAEIPVPPASMRKRRKEIKKMTSTLGPKVVVEFGPKVAVIKGKTGWLKKLLSRSRS